MGGLENIEWGAERRRQTIEHCPDCGMLSQSLQAGKPQSLSHPHFLSLHSPNPVCAEPIRFSSAHSLPNQCTNVSYTWLYLRPGTRQQTLDGAHHCNFCLKQSLCCMFITELPFWEWKSLQSSPRSVKWTSNSLSWFSGRPPCILDTVSRSSSNTVRFLNGWQLNGSKNA